MNNKIADAFYNEDFKELEKLTGIKSKSLKEFELKFEEQKNTLTEKNKRGAKIPNIKTEVKGGLKK